MILKSQLGKIPAEFLNLRLGDYLKLFVICDTWDLLSPKTARVGSI